MRFLFNLSFVLTFILLLSGCTGLPQGVEPVQGFELERYLGKWYEIARIENRFEEGLNAVTAQYSLRDDGGIDVLNRGFDAENNSWRSATGRAYFVSDSEVGHLKVSFFGPFYSSYVIFGLDDQHYQYAFISGYDHKFLWLLARTPEVEPKVRDKFIEKAKDLGFDLSTLVNVSHKMSRQ